MGADIHWIAERLHTDGIWEAAFSDQSYKLLEKDHIDYLIGNQNMAYLKFGDRNYVWFGLLSGVRTEPHPEIGEIAHYGFPRDISQYARLNFDDEDSLHSNGYFTKEDLTDALETLEPLDDGKDVNFKQQIDLISDAIAMIDNMISKKETEFPQIQFDNILIGRSYCIKTDIDFPEMLNESNHCRLIREDRIKGLLPMAEDTLRFIICYDS